MTKMPFDGTRVKIVGGITNSCKRLFTNFSDKNEWVVVGVGETMTNGESMVNVRNLHGIMNNQIMQFTKEELEELK